MKRQIVAMILVGGLVVGLCGCGDSGSSSTPWVETQTEETSAPMEAAEETTPEEVTEVETGYSFDDLVELWSSGTLLREEIVEMAMAGEIEYEVFEEFLAYADEVWENGNAGGGGSSIDTPSLLATHVIEYEDQDGYKIRETVQLSPIFREDDMETAYALWEALGNDVASFPSEEKIYDNSYLIRSSRDQDSCDKLEYIIGTFAIENLTDGFPITPDKPREYFGRLQGEYILSSDERSDDHDGNAANLLNVRSVSMVMYDNGPTYYGEGRFAILGNPKMTSDAWGPVCFVIAVPNGATPNRPDGYRYDKAWIEFGQKFYSDAGYDVFRLEYFAKEVN